MKLEQKYLVLQLEDIYDYLASYQLDDLASIINIIEEKRQKLGKEPNPKYICIRDTCPEYELTLKLLSDRLDNENIIHS